MGVACGHNAECMPVGGGTPEPGPPRREYDLRVGWAICTRHFGNREGGWEEKDTERVARSPTQQDVADVRSFSVRRRPRELSSFSTCPCAPYVPALSPFLYSLVCSSSRPFPCSPVFVFRLPSSPRCSTMRSCPSNKLYPHAAAT
ncbi:hypothetical protein RSOLAG1IB_11046 [Rhizoctonia solani AG-1 IB]|uniref:Uncharacterized protein n=1 Tax=Thanatephorus cucumeris (strain AG1-IB / isolate 7/3/14) TaxID=1108050 RepID=A0A0B7G6F2_THACB|nr:hypothetical protein RSOLAG1IB_11046 [Rhizoctonia solani AG-1 IB]